MLLSLQIFFKNCVFYVVPATATIRPQPSNVLVMGDGPQAGKVKIADFGLARFFQARGMHACMHVCTSVCR
jgi:serine/threonine protein kinase